MNKLKSVALAVVLACPIVATAQTSGSTTTSGSADQPGRAHGSDKHTKNDKSVQPAGAASGSVDPASQAERDRPQGGSTAGANGRQDPTIKLTAPGSESARTGSTTPGQRTRPDQGGSTAGANGAQDPTIKKDASTPSK